MTSTAVTAQSWGCSEFIFFFLLFLSLITVSFATDTTTTVTTPGNYTLEPINSFIDPSISILGHAMVYDSKFHLLFVSDPSYNNTGIVFVYRCLSFEPVNCTLVLTINSPPSVFLYKPSFNSTLFGHALALLGTKFLFVGAPMEQYRVGAVYLFEITETTTTGGVTACLLQKFDPFQWGELFGYTIAVRGDWLAVGAPAVPGDWMMTSGRIYLYKKLSSSSIWSDKPVVLNDAPNIYGLFGSAIAFLNDREILVGAPRERQVYHYIYMNHYWTLNEKIDAETWSPPYKSGDHFGQSIAVQDENHIVISAVEDGWAVLLARDNLTNPWTYVDTFTSDYDCYFGRGMAIFSDILFIGCSSKLYLYDYNIYWSLYWNTRPFNDSFINLYRLDEQGSWKEACLRWSDSGLSSLPSLTDSGGGDGFGWEMLPISLNTVLVFTKDHHSVYALHPSSCLTHCQKGQRCNVAPEDNGGDGVGNVTCSCKQENYIPQGKNGPCVPNPCDVSSCSSCYDETIPNLICSCEPEIIGNTMNKKCEVTFLDTTITDLHPIFGDAIFHNVTFLVQPQNYNNNTNSTTTSTITTYVEGSFEFLSSQLVISSDVINSNNTNPLVSIGKCVSFQNSSLKISQYPISTPTTTTLIQLFNFSCINGTLSLVTPPTTTNQCKWVTVKANYTSNSMGLLFQLNGDDCDDNFKGWPWWSWLCVVGGVLVVALVITAAVITVAPKKLFPFRKRTLWELKQAES